MPDKGKIYEFGEFRFDRERNVLLRGDKLVTEAPPKALEILGVLLESSGSVVTKDELISRVWPDTFVEEANLAHHIFRLRKALGNGDDTKFIETVPRRGYRFAFPVRTANDSASLVSNIQPAAVSQKPYKIYGVVGALAAVCIATGAYWFVSSQNNQAGNTETANKSLSAPTEAKVVKVTNSGKVGAAAISRDGKFITYSQNADSGEGQLYIRQTDTNREIPLLDAGERMFGAKAFSPAGDQIYFYMRDESEPLGAMYRIPVLGGRPTKIASNHGSFFSITNDGTSLLAYRRDTDNKRTSILKIATDGSGEQIVKDFDDREILAVGTPILSHDGSKIIFPAQSEVGGNDLNLAAIRFSILDVASGSITDMTPLTWNHTGLMTWMPDGKSIVLVGTLPGEENKYFRVSYPEGKIEQITKGGGFGFWSMGITSDGKKVIADVWESNSSLWSINADGNITTAKQLTLGDDDGERGIAPLADGSIIYSSLSGDDYDLWRMSFNNGKVEGQPVTSEKFYDAEPVAMPDGKTIVFSSDRAGSRHLFKMNIDGSNIKQLTFGDKNEKWPAVSPDGKWIAYHGMINARDSYIYRIPADGGEPQKLTSFDASFPSYSPDGKYLACVETSKPGQELANLVVIPADGGAPIKSWPVVQDDVLNYKNMPWTPDGKSIIFGKLENSITNLWKLDVATGETRKLTDFKSDTAYHFTLSHDGKQIIMARGRVTIDVAMLKIDSPL